MVSKPKGKQSLERIKSGIPGLDKLIGGGFLKGHTILVTGPAGAGKTIFCCQFIWEGLKNGEKCMYITFEELPAEIKADAATFGWDFEKYEKEGKLILTFKDPFQTTDISTRLQNEIRQMGITRVVIDSTSLLGLYFKDPNDIRRELYKLITALKNSGTTSLLTAEAPEDGKISRFGVEEYVVDGVVIMRGLEMGEIGVHSIQVIKMRRTKIDGSMCVLEFTKEGLKIRKEDRI